MIDLSDLASFVDDHKVALWWVAALSFVLFIGCLVIVPWLVVKIPEDYFLSKQRPKTPFADHHPILRWTGLILKNFVGGILVLAGILMLVLPGQGILTLAIGIMLMNFPGKHRLERRIIQMGPVLKSINWLRAKSDANPIRIEETSRSASPGDASTGDA